MQTFRSRGRPLCGDKYIMMISTRGRYALRVMLDLAYHSGDGYIPMRDIAARQQISQKYMEQIMPILARSGIVTAVHGKGGGYKLTRDANEYRVGEILRLTEGDLAPVSCLSCGAEPCPRACGCKTLAMWENFQRITENYFDGITIADLMDGENTYTYDI